jgi:shikimate kinase
MTARCVLVGAPGAGKTSVGAAVAERLGVTLRDTDHDIEGLTGMAVADIFLVQGEDSFRALEVEAVAAALAGHDGVVALGGGAILSADTRARLIADPAPVIWLEVGLAAGLDRVGLAKARPVLAMNPRARLSQLLSERAPLYTEVSDRRIDTDGRTIDEIADEIAAGLS